MGRTGTSVSKAGEHSLHCSHSPLKRSRLGIRRGLPFRFSQPSEGGVTPIGRAGRNWPHPRHAASLSCCLQRGFPRISPGGMSPKWVSVGHGMGFPTGTRRQPRSPLRCLGSLAELALSRGTAGGGRGQTLLQCRWRQAGGDRPAKTGQQPCVGRATEPKPHGSRRPSICTA